MATRSARRLKIKGKRYLLWRAVRPGDGPVLDTLVQARRDQEAAERFLRCVLDGVRWSRPPRSTILHSRPRAVPVRATYNHARKDD